MIGVSSFVGRFCLNCDWKQDSLPACLSVCLFVSKVHKSTRHVVRYTRGIDELGADWKPVTNGQRQAGVYNWTPRWYLQSYAAVGRPAAARAVARGCCVLLYIFPSSTNWLRTQRWRRPSSNCSAAAAAAATAAVSNFVLHWAMLTCPSLFAGCVVSLLTFSLPSCSNVYQLIPVATNNPFLPCDCM